jgi:8-oxo-dGTP diphosphatase
VSNGAVIRVSAGIVFDNEGRVLIAERVDDGPFVGLWEFPGGKIAHGETPLAALKRELHEEIGIAVRRCQAFMRVHHEYSDRTVDLRFFKVFDWTGRAIGRDGQSLRWLPPNDIRATDMLPADAPVISALAGDTVLSR